MYLKRSDLGDRRRAADQKSLSSKVYFSVAEMHLRVCEYAFWNSCRIGCHADSARSVPLDDVVLLCSDALCVYFCVRNGIDPVFVGGVFQGYSIFVLRLYADLAISHADHLSGRTASVLEIRFYSQIEPHVLLHAYDPIVCDVRNAAEYSRAFDVYLLRIGCSDGGGYRFQESARQIYTLFLRKCSWKTRLNYMILS